MFFDLYSLDYTTLADLLVAGKGRILDAVFVCKICKLWNVIILFIVESICWPSIIPTANSLRFICLPLGYLQERVNMI